MPGYILTDKDFQILVANLFDYVNLNTGVSITDHVEGRLHWNSDDGTAEIDMPGGNVHLQVGQEVLVRCTNKTGTTIVNGSVVYISGAQGNRPTITKARADSVATVDIIGVTTEDIANNANGYVTLIGEVRDIDTSAYVAGTPLYLSATTAGAFTDTAPEAPNHTVYVGVVITQSATTGVISVSSKRVPLLTGLSDIFGSPSDKEVPIWDAANSRFHFQGGDTLRTSMGVGTTDSPTFAGADFTGPVTGIALNEIEDPTTDHTFTMGAHTLEWRFTNPAGGVKYTWLGNATDHLFELNQHTGAPASGTHLMHIQWEDSNVTGLHLEASGNTDISQKFNVAGDTEYRFNILADGTLKWGDGINTPDTNLYRSATDTLKTNDALIVGGNLTTDTIINDSGNITISPASGILSVYNDISFGGGGLLTELGSNPVLTATAGNSLYLGANSSDYSGYQILLFHDGNTYIPNAYGVNLSGDTVRPVFANNAGKIGYDSDYTAFAYPGAGIAVSTGSTWGTSLSSSWIDQDVSQSASPTFGGATLSGNLAIPDSGYIGTTADSSLLRLSGSGSTSALRVNGLRPLYLSGGSPGVWKNASTGGWAFGYGVNNNAGDTTLSEWGMFGSGDSFSYGYFGPAFNDNYFQIKPTQVEIPNPLFIGDTSNANNTKGLTINQGTSNNEILTLKSSYISQPFTDHHEADTFAAFLTNDSGGGGLRIDSLTDADSGLGAFRVVAVMGVSDPTDSHPVIRFDAYKSDGATSIAALADAERIAEFTNGGADKWYINGNGDQHWTSLQYAPDTYANDMNGFTMRDLQIQDTGELGYDSSTMRSKQDIDYNPNASWLHSLRPVTYRPRKNISFTRYGLIAEDTALIAPYNSNIVGWGNQYGEYSPEYINYKELIVPLLIEVQNLRTELNQLKGV